MTKKAVAVVSGGMDSTVLVYDLLNKGYDVTMLSVDYGQRHRVELDYARRTATRLGLKRHIADLTGITTLISKSALTSGLDVPDGHYAEDTMRQTVVPNRNSIMLNVAIGFAVTIGADTVATAVHSGDHYIYPDCRPEFIDALNVLASTACEGFLADDFRVLAPYVNISKDAIAAIGDDLNVPWEDTWSCYKGDTHHCGSCGTCYERREAFTLAGIVDPTTYLAEPDYADPR
jgi:7-cyano-7-deazaguanine synthase